MKVVAAILAAGRGERFGADKSQALLGGKPVWRWSFDAYSSHPLLAGVGLVGSAANLGALKSAPNSLFVVPGGSDRRESSKLAVEACPPDADVVLVHDAARPFVTARLISEIVSAAARSGAAAPGIPVTDTVKRVDSGTVETVDRKGLWTVQTPQGGRRDLFLRAHAEARGDVTDDLGLFEAIGIEPEIVPGDPANVKITTPEDIARWESSRGLSEVRTGMGYDVHAFSADPSRALMLGGVRFEGHPGLEGHSDADVVLHAAVDALLGAAGLGDIGVHFPNSDPAWKNAPSLDFLAHAAKLLQDGNWMLQNLDITVIAEHPRIMARAQEIRAAIAQAAGTGPDRISVKATTNERLGFIGRGEGIAALATATISKK
jgi:2-C-methyl-D-erythritol 4-phosphate cytidylyltransferase/2-C-methyl-D-erythritol 2,4-cyclodiphosphate synthase